MTNPSCKDHLTDNLYQLDKKRYLGKMPIYQKFFRKTQTPKSILKKIYKLLFTMAKKFYHVEIGASTDIGAGLYIGHPYQDVPSHSVVFGSPCIIKHKDEATLGYINRPV